MTCFALKIVTPDGLQYDAPAQELIVRTVSGDLGILAGHIDCIAPLGMGRATVVTEDGSRKYAACIGGMVSVLGGAVTLVPTTFEWAESIDAARAERSLERAQAVLSSKDATSAELRLAEARLHRALVRRSVAAGK
ncbi:MAG: ATP synthase F1 subunit epsilon [Firmicutes bacterium]|nr:ATP synthase F1 subunit epsilon [Bacillota bacterium]